MSKRKPPHASDYVVGYGKPPASTQFKPGNQVARRRKEKPRLEAINSMVEEALLELVPVKLRNGRTVKIPAIKAIIVQARNRALQGDERGIKQVFEIIERRGLAGAPKTEQEKFYADLADVGARLKAKLEKRVAADKVAKAKNPGSDPT
jgi:hypothetical protein